MTKNKFKKIFSILGVTIALLAMLSFRVSFSNASGRYFGGMRVFSLTCTCSGNTLVYINDYASGGELALTYDGSGRLYSNNNIYGTYLMGSYSPGGNCQMYVGEDCIEINSDGSFDSSPGTGTS